MMTQLLDAFATVMSYPEGGYRQALVNLRLRIAECGVIDVDSEETGILQNHVDAFMAETKNFSLQDLEELYTRTFDINPVSSLEIGWQLYGEAYERGAFLVSMRELLRRCGIDESTELPDHLTHVLKLLGRLERDEAIAFARRSLLPALDKMLEGFSKESNPYEHILRALKLFSERRSTQGVTNHG